MKKLMIAAAIVCAAAFAQAASLNWGFFNVDGITNPNGTGLWNGQMTIACAALSFQETIEVDDGDIYDHFGIVSQQGATYTFVITAKDGDYTYSQSASGSADSTAGNVYFDGGNAWTKGPDPTPEPTSAMLMLLGVAGLALKRKQRG